VGAIPPPPTGCGDDHDWQRTDTVTVWSAKERLLWDRCRRCGKERFVTVDRLPLERLLDRGVEVDRQN